MNAWSLFGICYERNECAQSERRCSCPWDLIRSICEYEAFSFCSLESAAIWLTDDGLPNQPYIYVEGKAEIEKPADMAILTFDLLVRAADLPKANEQLQSQANKIFALLHDRKISENDVIAEALTSEPEFEQEETYPRRRGKLIDYRVTRTFKVRVRDVARFQNS